MPAKIKGFIVFKEKLKIGIRWYDIVRSVKICE